MSADGRDVSGLPGGCCDGAPSCAPGSIQSAGLDDQDSNHPLRNSRAVYGADYVNGKDKKRGTTMEDKNIGLIRNYGLQAYIDALTEEARQERSKTQMTLGKLIEVLEAMDGATQVDNLRNRHSFRGYYSDLAFEHGPGTRPASELLQECRNVMGRTLGGYKGGEFLMEERTPVWVAEYSFLGNRLMSFDGGKIVTEPEEVNYGG
jgi:hypothetical protein